MDKFTRHAQTALNVLAILFIVLYLIFQDVLCLSSLLTGLLILASLLPSIKIPGPGARYYTVHLSDFM